MSLFEVLSKKDIKVDEDRIKDFLEDPFWHVERRENERVVRAEYHPLDFFSSRIFPEHFLTTYSYYPDKELVILRGGMGYGKLYYFWNNKTLCVSSNPLAIIISKVAPPLINWQTVWDFFSFGFSPQPATFFENIRQVTPFTEIRIHLNSGKFELKRSEGEKLEIKGGRKSFLKTLHLHLREALKEFAGGKILIFPRSLSSLILERVASEYQIKGEFYSGEYLSPQEIIENFRRIIERTGEALSEIFILTEGVFSLFLKEEILTPFFVCAGGGFVSGTWELWNKMMFARRNENPLLEYFSIFNYEEKNLLLRDILKDLNLNLESSSRIIQRYTKNSLLQSFLLQEVIPSLVTYPLRASPKKGKILLPFLHPNLLLLISFLPLKERKGIFGKDLLPYHIKREFHVSEDNILENSHYYLFEKAILAYVEDWLVRRMGESSAILNWEYVEEMKESYEKRKDLKILRKLTTIVAFDIFFRNLAKWT